MYAVLAGMLGFLIYQPKKLSESGENFTSVAPVTVEAKEEITQPIRITAKMIGLDAPIISVGLEDGLMKVPDDNETISWYNLGPKPGETGHAVLAGHNEWGGKPGVLANLKNLRLGDTISIAASDGSLKEFRVSDITTYSTVDFPTDEIYNGKDGNKIILITCSGRYQRTLGTFDKRLVVTAQ